MHVSFAVCTRCVMLECFSLLCSYIDGVSFVNARVHGFHHSVDQRTVR